MKAKKTETKSLIRLALILTNYISWYSCKKLFRSRTGCITMRQASQVVFFFLIENFRTISRSLSKKSYEVENQMKKGDSKNRTVFFGKNTISKKNNTEMSIR